MRVVEHSRASVTEVLSDLEAAHSSFPVNQTTVAVPAEQFDAVQAHSSGCLDLYATVRNGDGDILHLSTESGHALPGTSVPESVELEETLKETVRTETGVECRLDGITEGRILGIRDESGRSDETLYRLAVVFEAEYHDGTPDREAVWLEDVQGLEVYAD